MHRRARMCKEGSFSDVSSSVQRDWEDGASTRSPAAQVLDYLCWIPLACAAHFLGSPRTCHLLSTWCTLGLASLPARVHARRIGLLWWHVALLASFSSALALFAAPGSLAFFSYYILASTLSLAALFPSRTFTRCLAPSFVFEPVFSLFFASRRFRKQNATNQL